MDTNRKVGPLSILALLVREGTVFILHDAWNYFRRSLRPLLPNRVPGQLRTGFDVLGKKELANPYPEYDDLRQGPAARYSPKHNIWLISRYDAVKQASRAHDTLISGEGIVRVRFHLPSIISIDNPDHARLRALTMPSFTRKSLDRLGEWIDQLAEQLVAPLADGREHEFVEEVAAPMPMMAISHMLGVPVEDYADFHRWSRRIVKVAEVRLAPNILREGFALLMGIFPMNHYLQRIRRQRNWTRDDSLIAEWSRAVERGEITESEYFWLVVIVLIAGNETTTSLLGALVNVFAEQPDVYDRLREEPGLISSCTLEGLRYSSPVQGFYRTALVDYDAEGQRIPAGSRVLLAFGAANHDPAHYPDPESFKIDRDPVDHLAFGHGVHHCLGALLAKMESDAILRAMVANVAKVELAAPAEQGTNPTLWGFAKVPVRFVPAVQGAERQSRESRSSEGSDIRRGERNLRHAGGVQITREPR
ncbi:MAG: cytochrome P450 [Segniliparus sp.]|uniref:cytochrome P450 n=1 Tax=Segniliparus sp. TaxID=2804064 RepID=UPI003F30D87B